MSKKKAATKKPEQSTKRTFPFEGEWQLMDKNSLPVFWTELMSFSTGKGKNKVDLGCMGVALNGAALYLFTKDPHPDDKERSATYALPLSEPVKAALAHLQKLKE